MYLSQLAMIAFHVIRTTCDWFFDAFKDPAMGSSFVTWAKVEMAKFLDIFDKQLAYADDIRSVTDATQAVWSHVNTVSASFPGSRSSDRRRR